ncbi:hypothetical protein ACKC5O_00635 [Aeromonas schubertii]|uniref:hypothetical protein n=1 Tax=Aeromonas schubertii TaxID=652 RepID=UPI0038B57BA9
MKRYDLELTATGPVMEESKEGAFVPFSEVSGLADTVMKMGSRCTLLADLLREVTQIVPAIGVTIDDLPVVDAFLERIEVALAGQALERIGSNALAMMMDELHDICAGLDAPGGAQNGAEAWDQVKGARDRALAGLHQDRPDTEWTDATTSPVAADYRELQAQHDALQSKYKAAQNLVRDIVGFDRELEGDDVIGTMADRIDALLADKLPDPAMSVTETIRTAPARIWLQVGDQSHYQSEPFPIDTSEVSWCADSVVGCEVPYVRADLVGHVVSPSLSALIQMTDILKMCRSALITAHEDVHDDAGKGVIQYRIKLATKAINMAEHAIDASQVKSGRFITEGQELELITVLQSIVNGFSDDPAHDAAALLKRITGEVPWTGDSFQLPPHQGGEPCATEPPSSSPA